MIQAYHDRAAVGGVPAKLPGTKMPTLALAAIPLSFPPPESQRR